MFGNGRRPVPPHGTRAPRRTACARAGEWCLADAFAVQALAAAAGPEFLRDVRAGGQPVSVADDRRVLSRPPPDRMKPIVERYVTYWVDRLGRDHFARVIQNSKDHDRVWAWYVGREAELAALAEVKP